MENKEKLKKCPFCGKKPNIKKNLKSLTLEFQVSCDYINCSVGPETIFQQTKEFAIQSWNTRPKIDEKEITNKIKPLIKRGFMNMYKSAYEDKTLEGCSYAPNLSSEKEIIKLAQGIVREKLEVRCKYFNGWQNKECKNNVIYEEFRMEFIELPCLDGKGNACQHYMPKTKEEIDKYIAEIDNIFNLIGKNLSPCCNAEIDNSQVIKDGSHKGHGARFCSKCKKLVYIV